MSTYLTDNAAREHANSLLAEAARSRRAHEARLARRAATQATARSTTGRRAGRSFRHPIAAAHHWLVAGEL